MGSNPTPKVAPKPKLAKINFKHVPKVMPKTKILQKNPKPNVNLKLPKIPKKQVNTLNYNKKFDQNNNHKVKAVNKNKISSHKQGIDKMNPINTNHHSNIANTPKPVIKSKSIPKVNAAHKIPTIKKTSAPVKPKTIPPKVSKVNVVSKSNSKTHSNQNYPTHMHKTAKPIIKKVIPTVAPKLKVVHKPKIVPKLKTIPKQIPKKVQPKITPKKQPLAKRRPVQLNVGKVPTFKSIPPKKKNMNLLKAKTVPKQHPKQLQQNIISKSKKIVAKSKVNTKVPKGKIVPKVQRNGKLPAPKKTKTAVPPVKAKQLQHATKVPSKTRVVKVIIACRVRNND